MRAVILAAGRGSRMGNATDAQPKCLTVIAGKPLIDWQYEAIINAGVTDIIVVGGYRSETLRNDKYHLALNPDWETTNMAATLFCVGEYEGDTLVSYSDILYPPEHIKSLISLDADIAITADVLWRSLWEQRFADPLKDAETFKSKDGVLVEIGGKTDNISEIEAQYMGLLKFSRKGFKSAKDVFESLPSEKRNKLDMTSLLRLLMAENEEIRVAEVKGKWCEVDNQNDLDTYNCMIKKGGWPHDWRVF
jgi:choline kinase